MNVDKPVCENIISTPQACCYGADNFVRDCPNKSVQYNWNTNTLFCNNTQIQMNMKDICPNNVTLTLPVNEDCTECENIRSLQDAYCEDVDTYISKCPYQSIKNGWSKESINNLADKNFKCSTEKKLSKCPTSSYTKTIIYSIIAISFIYLIYYLFKTGYFKLK